MQVANMNNCNTVSLCRFAMINLSWLNSIWNDFNTLKNNQKLLQDTYQFYNWEIKVSSKCTNWIRKYVIHIPLCIKCVVVIDKTKADLLQRLINLRQQLVFHNFTIYYVYYTLYQRQYRIILLFKIISTFATRSQKHIEKR